MFKVLFDFTAEDEGELSVYVDELVNSATGIEEDGWMLVTSDDGASGFVPVEFLQLCTEIDQGGEPPANTSNPPAQQSAPAPAPAPAPATGPLTAAMLSPPPPMSFRSPLLSTPAAPAAPSPLFCARPARSAD